MSETRKVYPPSTAWVSSFAESVNRAIGDVYGWELYDTQDPLRFVLLVRLTRNYEPRERPPLRKLLSSWAEANKCIYRRSHFTKTDFKALLIIPQWGPKSDELPF